LGRAALVHLPSWLLYRRLTRQQDSQTGIVLNISHPLHNLRAELACDKETWQAEGLLPLKLSQFQPCGRSALSSSRRVCSLLCRASPQRPAQDCLDRPHLSSRAVETPSRVRRPRRERSTPK
jgi:hypothetical protein